MFNVIKFWKIFISIAWSPLYFGGSDFSENDTATTNTDNSSVASEGSVSQSGSGTINMLDGGAIRMAFDASTANYGALLSSTASAFQNMLNFGKDAQKNAIALVDTANSKGSIDNKTVMILGGGALLALSIFFMRRKAA